MAKRKPKAEPEARSEEDIMDDMTSRIRTAIEETPGADPASLGEERYVTLSLNALDVVKSGLEMRAEELEAEKLDDEDEDE